MSKCNYCINQRWLYLIFEKMFDIFNLPFVATPNISSANEHSKWTFVFAIITNYTNNKMENSLKLFFFKHIKKMLLALYRNAFQAT